MALFYPYSSDWLQVWWQRPACSVTDALQLGKKTTSINFANRNRIKIAHPQRPLPLKAVSRHLDPLLPSARRTSFELMYLCNLPSTMAVTVKPYIDKRPLLQFEMTGISILTIICSCLQLPSRDAVPRRNKTVRSGLQVHCNSIWLANLVPRAERMHLSFGSLQSSYNTYSGSVKKPQANNPLPKGSQCLPQHEQLRQMGTDVWRKGREEFWKTASPNAPVSGQDCNPWQRAGKHNEIAFFPLWITAKEKYEKKPHPFS